MNHQVIKLPEMPPQVSINAEWLQARDELLITSREITRINGQGTFECAEILLKKITGTSNKLEKLRKELVKPLQDAQKIVKKAADTARDPLEQEKIRLKKLMTAFLDEVEEQRRKEEEARLAAQAESESPFAEFLEPEPSETDTPEVDRNFSSVTKVWTFEITNPAQVPREFCSPDEKKIREHVKTYGKTAKIPGVTIKQETNIQSR